MSLKKFLTKHDIKGALPDKRVATVAVVHGKHLLMGKRRDNGRWTVPGGHANDGEALHIAGARELEEESGIKTHHSNLTPMGESEIVKNDKGQTVEVQPYKFKPSKKPGTSMTDDPDAEVARWHWIDVSKGLPKHIATNMHVPRGRNVLMKRLNLHGDAER